MYEAAGRDSNVEPDVCQAHGRHGLPVEVVAGAVPAVGQGRDRSPRSLALLLAKTVERVRTDPDVNFEHGAVRGAALVLLDRLWDRLPEGGGEHATEDS